MERVLAKREEEARLAEVARQTEEERRLLSEDEKRRVEEEKQSRVEKERLKQKAEEAERERAAEQALRARREEKQIKPDRPDVTIPATVHEAQVLESHTPSVITDATPERGNKSKRTMILVIGGAVVLALFALILAKLATSGERRSANSNAGTQQTGQTAGTPPATAPSPSPTPTLISTPAMAAGDWDGEWSDSKGNVLSCELRLVQDVKNNMSGSMVWTFRKTRRPDLQKKIGLSGVEHVTGTFQVSERLLNLRGYRKDDPHAFLALDRYRLFLSTDGRTLSGQSQLQKGRLSAVRKN